MTAKAVLDIKIRNLLNALETLASTRTWDAANDVLVTYAQLKKRSNPDNPSTIPELKEKALAQALTWYRKEVKGKPTIVGSRDLEKLLNTLHVLDHELQ